VLRKPMEDSTMRSAEAVFLSVAVLIFVGPWNRIQAEQPPFMHSSIATSGGTLSDDQLAEMIEDAIDSAPHRPSSVKVFFQTCYGGGMLDEISDMLGEYDPPIPFVGSSACHWDGTSLGPTRTTLRENPEHGCYWTETLADAIEAGGPGTNVMGDAQYAMDNNPVRKGGEYEYYWPDGADPEEGRILATDGGPSVGWSQGQAVVFNGYATHGYHNSDHSRISDAFENVTGRPAMGSINDGSASDLQELLNKACQSLDSSDELVLYFGSHGDLHYDVGGWFSGTVGAPASLGPISEIDTINVPGGTFQLAEGYVQGLDANAAQGDAVNPGLLIAGDLDPLLYGSDYEFDVFFDIYFNGAKLIDPEFLPLSMEILDPDPALVPVEVFVPIPYDLFEPDDNVLQILLAPDRPGDPLEVDLALLELTTGPINQIQGVPEPSSLLLTSAICIVAHWQRNRRTGPTSPGPRHPEY
jgi:hypothetical protein